MYYVYQLRLETSDKPFYIGKGRGYRSRQHMSPSRRKADTHKNRVINKALRDGVKVLVEILHEDLSESDAFTKEVELIAFYGRRINGGCLTNATDGGEGVSGYRHTNEARAAMAEAKRGRRLDQETREKNFKGWQEP